MQRHVKWLRTTAPCVGRIMGSYYGLVSGKQTSNFAFSGDGPSHRRNEIDFHELGARCVKPYSASYSCSHGPVGRLYAFNAKQISEDRPQAGGYSSSSLGAVFGDQGLVL